MDRDYEMAVKVGSEARKNLYVVRLSYSRGGQLHPIGPVRLVASPESGPGHCGGNRTRPLFSLGCARPPSPAKARMESLAVAAGINALTYPSEVSIDCARSLSLEVEWVETCCNL